MLRAEAFRVAPEAALDDRERVRLGERLQLFHPAWARAQDGEGLVLGLAVRRSDDGGDDAHARRQFARQPVQPVRAVRGVKLVERVEDEDDPPPARGFGEELLEMGDEFLDVERRRVGVLRGGGEFVAEAAERAAEVGGAVAGADESRKDEG